MSLLDKLINDENTFVSVKTIKEALSSSEQEALSISEEEKEKFKEQNDYLVSEINKMKENAAFTSELNLFIPGTKDTSPPGHCFIGDEEDRYAPMGIPTDFFINGIRLHSGDEVITDTGIRGFIVIANSPSRYKERYFNVHLRFHRGVPEYNNEYLVLSREDYYLFGCSKISIDRFAIHRHFNTFRKGDTIVNGVDPKEKFVVHSKTTTEAQKLNLFKQEVNRSKGLYLEVPAVDNKEKMEYYPIGVGTDCLINGIRVYSGDKLVTDKGLEGILLVGETEPDEIGKQDSIYLQTKDKRYVLLDAKAEGQFKGSRARLLVSRYEFEMHFTQVHEGFRHFNTRGMDDGFLVVSKETAHANRQEEFQ